jgi:hypothetical protein
VFADRNFLEKELEMKLTQMAMIAMILLLPIRASADALPGLTRYLKTEIANSSLALASPAPAMAGDEFFFRRWLVRLQATFGIEVPWIATFQIIPEVELVWQRSYPQGWSDYKPRAR